MDTIIVNITEVPEVITVNIAECVLLGESDGVTITGDGSFDNPYTAIGGSPPVMIPVVAQDTRVLLQSEWAAFGAVPTIEVFYNDGSAFITIPVQPIFDTMPIPTTITITISGITTETWYIKLS